MASKSQLEKYAKDPNVRKFLDLIAHTEGTEGNGYRTAFGGARLGSLNDHPRYLKTFTQQNGKQNKTSAAGRYQFLTGTWDRVSRQYGLKDFGAHNQDLGAIALLIGRGALPHILKGDWQTGVQKSGGEWASLPSAPKSYSQPTRSWNNVARFMGGKAPTSQPQQAQFARPERIYIADLQAREQQSSAFKRPDRIPISELQPASQFERPERVPISQLQATEQAPSVFERPARVPITDLQGNERPQRVPIAELETQFARPERIPIEQLQATEINPMPQPELEPQQI